MKKHERGKGGGLSGREEGVVESEKERVGGFLGEGEGKREGKAVATHC